MLSGWNEEDKYVKIVQMKLNKLNFYKLESFQVGMSQIASGGHTVGNCF